MSFETQELRAAATRVGVAVVQSCTDVDLEGTLRAVVQDVEFGVDEPAGPLGTLDPGTYGLIARAWNDDCELVAAACRPITVEGGGGETLSIEMLGRGGRRCAPGRACSAGVCEASQDGSVADATSDAGVDAPADAGADVRDVGADVGVEDAGAMDASMDASRDTGPADAGHDAGGETFCTRHGAGAYACLDFEVTPTVNGWSFEESGAVITDEAGGGVSGNAARVTGSDGGSASIRHDLLGPHNAGTMWVRMKVRVSAADAANLDFMNLFAINDPDNAPFSYMAVSLTGARGLQLAHNAVIASTPAAAPFPVNDWFCVELEFDNSADATMRLHVDGSSVLTVGALSGPSTWSRIWVGARGIGEGQAEATYLIDDFVWSSNRVPCALE